MEIHYAEHELVSLGRNAARQLKMLLPLVRGDRKQENRNLFDSVEARPPELEDQMWGTLAFVAGIYAGFMGSWKCRSNNA